MDDVLPISITRKTENGIETFIGFFISSVKEQLAETTNNQQLVIDFYQKVRICLSSK